MLNNPYTVYTIFKQNVPESEWYGVFVTDDNMFGIYENNNKIGVFNPVNFSQSYMSDISSLDYHVCAITFYNNLGSLYVDGVLKYTRNVLRLSDKFHNIHSIANYKMIALCNNAAHSSADILENTQYLAQKYEIEI